VSGAVALPSRALGGTEHRLSGAQLTRGQNGPVAVPSREAALAGTGAAEQPTRTPGERSGAWGFILSLLHYSPPVDWTRLRGTLPLAKPRGYDAVHYVRRYHANVAGIDGFVPSHPGLGLMSTTLDRPADGGDPAAPLTYDRIRVVQTFAEGFDTSIWSDYHPQLPIQDTQIGRRVKKGTRGQMRAGWQQRRTVLAPPISYGQQTPVLVGTPPAADARSPYGGL
jgi:hypothetical protein